MNILFLVAAILSLLIAALHYFVGGKNIMRPFLSESRLSDDVRYVQYFCWHISTLGILLLVVLFGAAALFPQLHVLGIVGSAFAAAVAGLGLWVPLYFKSSYKVVPQGWLFVPLVVLGVCAVL